MWFGSAAHMQARRKSSVSMISLTDSEAVTGGCGLGVASTCERRTGTWQHSAGRSASGCESVRPCCTCTQAAAVAEDEVGTKSFRYGVGALAQALQMSRFAASAEAVRLACAMSRSPRSFRLRRKTYVGRFRGLQHLAGPHLLAGGAHIGTALHPLDFHGRSSSTPERFLYIYIYTGNEQ